MIDTKNLRQLAEAATHGPWRHNKDNEQIGDVSLRDSDQTVAQAMMQVNGTWQQRDRNAAYIAACSPDVLLALLDALEHKDAEIEKLNYEHLHNFAEKNRVSYNELCAAVHDAMKESL